MTVPASLAEDAGKDGPDDGRSGSALFFCGGEAVWPYIDGGITICYAAMLYIFASSLP